MTARRRLAASLPAFSRAALVLALLGAPAVALHPAPALAQQAVFSEVLVEMLPLGDVTGDGATPVGCNFLALAPDGQPLSGLNAKVVATDGEAGAITEIRPGLYRFDWTPPAVRGQRNVTLTIKGRTADRTAFNRSFTVPVLPPLAHRVEIAANPPAITLGQDASATLTFTLTGGAPPVAAESELIVRSSAGTVANLTPLGGGTFSALYTPPSEAWPHLAILTVADRRDPSHTYGSLVLPLVGKANFPVTGLPNSRVILRVGDREFGPIQADAGGRAVVPIVVPPGIHEATLVSVLGDQRTEETVDLQIPASPRVRLFPVQATVAADPGITVPVRAVVARPDGSPDVSARVTFSTTAGAVTEARHEGGGVYVATWSPPYGTRAAKATITVRVEDEAGEQVDSLPVKLIGARPARVALSAEPAELGADTTAFKVFTSVQGPDGVGIPGRSIAFDAAGARLDGAVRDLGGGDYEARFVTTGSGPVDLIATVKGDASDNPLRRVVVVPSADRLPGDGLSSTLLTVLTLDEFGYPVANVPVKLQVVGDGSVPAQVTTGPSGMAQVTYTAGRTAGLVTVRATAGSHSGVVGLLQAPPTVAAGLALPPSGTQEQLNVVQAWRAIVASLHVPREGVATVAAAAHVPSRATAGPVARIEVECEPASAVPGGTVTLRVQARDAEGRGAAGRTFETVASAGTVGALQDLGGGSYQTTLTIPAGVTGEVKVSVLDPDQNVAGFVKIPVTSGSAWTTATTAPQASPPENAAAPEPAPAALGTTASTGQQVEKQRKATEPGEHPWLRVEAGYLGGLYSYQQKPLTSTGPLYDTTITVGGDAGSPGGAAGFGLRARAWSPGFDYGGAELSIRSSRWSMELGTAFDEPIPDWLTDFRAVLLGRYPIRRGGNLYHVGARLGFASNDFLVFKQEMQDGRPYLTYENLVVSGALLGVEAGAEAGRLFALAGLETGIVDGFPVYSVATDLTVGYAVTDQLTVQARVGSLNRDSTVYSQDASGDKKPVGQLTDAFTQVGLGVGWQL